MHKDFTICPHCFAKGKDRVIRPATPHRTPLVSRSDGASFHLFVEESYIRRTSSNVEVVALFRYDLDAAGAMGNSAMAQIPIVGNAETEALEQTADFLAEILAGATPLKSLYTPSDLHKRGGGDDDVAVA